MKIHRDNLGWSLWGSAGILALLFLIPLVVPGEGPIALGLGFDLKTLTALVVLPALFFLIGFRTNRYNPPDWLQLMILTAVYVLALLLLTRGTQLGTIALFAFFYIVCDIVGIFSGQSAQRKNRSQAENKTTAAGKAGR